MKTKNYAACPCGSGKLYRRCCGIHTKEKTYINESHEWMDTNILKGRNPHLHGYLVLIDHKIPAKEIWDHLQFWSEQYRDFGESRTKICHRIIDAAIDDHIEEDIRDGFNPPFCHKGCANCCYQPVACTDEEALLIFNYCVDNRIHIDFDKLERQLRFMEFDQDKNFTGISSWDNQAEIDRSCIFLDKALRTCMIWEVRPFVCRVHLAEKTDSHCRHINGVPDPEAIGIHYPVCSYILSSIFTIHHDSAGRMMNRLLLIMKA